MTFFWLSAMALIGLALVFVVLPVLRRDPYVDQDREAQNVDIARDRLAELEADLDAGAITPTEYAAGKEELETALASDLEGAAPKRAVRAEPGRGRWGGLIAAAMVPFAAIALYGYLGTPEGLDVRGPGQAMTAAQHAGGTLPDGRPLPPVEDMVGALVQRLAQEPDNAEGWVLLGRTYLVLNRHAEAAQAFEKARSLTGDEPDLLVAYAEALAMGQGERLSGQPAELLRVALNRAPDHPRALWLAGLAASQAQDYKTAVDYWRRLLPQVAGEPETKAQLEHVIAQAEARAGGSAQSPVSPLVQAPAEPQAVPEAATVAEAGTVPEAVAPGAGATVAEGGITVNVSLDEAQRERVSPEDTVFVFARAMQGPPMPLAVVRRQVKDLPVVVHLDDSQAMMPEMRLSNFPEVVVGARVSKSGLAMPQSGDVFGEVSPVETADAGSVTVVMNQVRE